MEMMITVNCATDAMKLEMIRHVVNLLSSNFLDRYLKTIRMKCMAANILIMIVNS
jgi:hypothetical protein